MSKREVAELACRFLALTLLVFHLDSLLILAWGLVIGVWGGLSQGDISGVGVLLLSLAVSWGLIMFVVWFLWTRSDWIAAKLVPDDANYSRWPRFRAADLQVVAFSTAGIFALVGAVKLFFQSLSPFILSYYGGPSYEPQITVIEWLLFEKTLVAFASGVLGLWLVFGSRGIVRFVRGFQRAEFRDPDNGAAREIEVTSALNASGKSAADS